MHASTSYQKKYIRKQELVNWNSDIEDKLGRQRNNNYPGDEDDVMKYWAKVAKKSTKYIAEYLKVKIKIRSPQKQALDEKHFIEPNFILIP